MTVIIPECGNQKVANYLCQLDRIAQSDLYESRNAKDELKRFWLSAERLKFLSAETVICEESSRSIGLAIRPVAINRYSLIIGLVAYLFAIENDILVFLTVCKRGLEDNGLILIEADMCFTLWKQSQGV